MRRILIALFIITGFAVTAAPAVAQDAGSGDSVTNSSETPPPAEETTPPPPAETTPPPADETTPPPATETPGTGEQTPGTGEATPGTGGSTTGSGESGSGAGGSNQSAGGPTTGMALRAASDTLVPADPALPPEHHVSICQANGGGFSSSSPTVTEILNGTGSGDIIPPFNYDGGHYDGKNFDDAGIAIYNNGCNVPGGSVDENAPPEASAALVTICHATGPGTFESATVDANSTAGGHDKDSADIIPPFEYTGGSYAGKNHDAKGQELLNSGCTSPDEQAAIEAAAVVKKVDICHRDSNVKKPYGPKKDNVSVQSIVNPNGHATHTGPVFPGANWGDIIPPFEYDGGSFAGLNWDADGQAIFFNNCQIPGDEEPPPPSENKVPICHARNFGQGGDPYNTPNPSVDGILNGHAGHTGPVFFPGIAEQWGDIIPPFDFGPGAQFDGLNWDADGQAIYFNGCKVPSDNPQCEDDPQADCDGDDDECEEDCDDDDDSDHEAALLPDTGGTSLWTLLMGGLLTVLGMTVLSNRESMGRVGLFGPVPSDALSLPWSYTYGRDVDLPTTVVKPEWHPGRWTALGAAAVVAAAVLGGRRHK